MRSCRRIRIGSPISSSPVLADLDGDGQVEIVVGGGRGVHALTLGGQPLPGWPASTRGPVASTAAVGLHDIAVGCDDDSLYLLDARGRLRPGFPVRTGGDIYSSPAWLTVAGERAIVFGSDDGRLYLADDRGRALPGWPLQLDDYISCSPLYIPSAGDGGLIVAGTWSGRVYAHDVHGSAAPGWPVSLRHFVWSSPVCGDIDGDGRPEVIVAAEAVYAFRLSGELLPGFPVPLGSYIVSSPALADLDGDGRCEIYVGADALYGIRGDGKIILRGETGRYCWASPIIADLDGDGREEIGIGSWDGVFRVFKPDRGCVGTIETGGPIFATAAVGDTGRGGAVLVVASWDGWLHVADLDHEIPDPSWPCFRRSGAHEAVAAPGGSPGAYHLAPIPSAPARARFEPGEVSIVPARGGGVGEPTTIGLGGGGAEAVERAVVHYLHPVKRRYMRAPMVNDSGLRALVQPFFEPCQVHYFLEGENRDGSVWRVPRAGTLTYRVRGNWRSLVRRAAMQIQVEARA